METRFKYTDCWKAAGEGDLEELKRMHEYGMPLFQEQSVGFLFQEDFVNCTATAALNGHLDCLRYAHENGCKWHQKTVLNAALKGHLDCLRYAFENGSVVDTEISALAAAGGYLDCLRFCHEKGLLWTEWTTEWAAIKGQLNCLKFAHENGCKWNIELTRVAAQYGQLDCLRYAIENDCPYDPENKKLMESIELIFKFNDIKKCSNKSFENHLSSNVINHIVAKYI